VVSGRTRILREGSCRRFTIDGTISYRTLFLQSYSARDPAVAGYLIGRLHAYLMDDRASAIRIGVGAEPQRDTERETNARHLASGVPPPFSTALTGGTQSADGSLMWDPRHPKAPRHRAWRYGRRPSVPLEVGYTDVETLWWHFKQCRGFARWPYGESEIVAVRCVN
jgi:hypothetical protein